MTRLRFWRSKPTHGDVEPRGRGASSGGNLGLLGRLPRAAARSSDPGSGPRDWRGDVTDGAAGLPDLEIGDLLDHPALRRTMCLGDRVA